MEDVLWTHGSLIFNNGGCPIGFQYVLYILVWFDYTIYIFYVDYLLVCKLQLWNCHLEPCYCLLRKCFLCSSHCLSWCWQYLTIHPISCLTMICSSFHCIYRALLSTTSHDKLEWCEALCHTDTHALTFFHPGINFYLIHHDITIQ